MAEDNEPNQRVAKALLRSAGFAIDIAGDGAKAVAMATATHYDVILMDLHMPVMDGLNATRALRQLDATRDVPIIGLTASVSREDRDLCLQAGMNEHMAKPVDWDQLIATADQARKADLRHCARQLRSTRHADAESIGFSPPQIGSLLQHDPVIGVGRQEGFTEPLTASHQTVILEKALALEAAQRQVDIVGAIEMGS